MKILSAFALAVLLSGVTARLNAGPAPVGPMGIAYLDDNLGDLFAGDPTTGDFSLVGTPSATAAGFGGFTDIGFAAGVLYGLSPTGELYTISTSTGQILTDVGNTGIASPGAVVGLSDSTANVLTAGGNGQIYNINTGTGAGSQIGGGGGGYQTAGDLDYDTANSTLYLTSTTPSSDTLFSISTSTGVGTNLGRLCSDGATCADPWTDVFGMIYDTQNGIMYGFDVDGDEFDVTLGNPNSSGTELALSGVTDEAGLLGAAFIVTPEPSTFVLIGSALILLAVGFRRKTNHTA